MSRFHRLALGLGLTCLLAAPQPGLAHFGLILPSDDIVSQGDPKNLQLQVEFLHPMEGPMMPMARPKQFGVLHEESRTDLLPTLQPATKGRDAAQGATTWTADFRIKRPGDYTFYLEPAPYWEPAEETFIVHFTKVCVNALGLEKGWDTPVGLPTEIIPKSRPYGLWRGNVFTGQVLVKGKPAADVEVEIEYLNASPDNPKKVAPPSNPFVTQVVKTDANGQFSYAMPRAGWWGFAALTHADWTLPHDGADKPVELGAVYWVHATAMP